MYKMDNKESLDREDGKKGGVKEE
jgi:hypothetical protein